MIICGFGLCLLNYFGPFSCFKKVIDFDDCFCITYNCSMGLGEMEIHGLGLKVGNLESNDFMI